MHCHLDVHTSWGLRMAWLVLDGPGPNQKLPPPPSDLPKCWWLTLNMTLWVRIHGALFHLLSDPPMSCPFLYNNKEIIVKFFWCVRGEVNKFLWLVCHCGVCSVNCLICCCHVWLDGLEEGEQFTSVFPPFWIIKSIMWWLKFDQLILCLSYSLFCFYSKSKLQIRLQIISNNMIVS